MFFYMTLMNTNNIFYVYAYLDTRKPGNFIYSNGKFQYEFDFEPFYIGKGFDDRFNVHLNMAIKTEKNSYKLNKIRAIIKESLDPMIVMVHKDLEETYALQLEISLISLIGRHDLKKGPLTNLTNGGDGISGYVFTEEQLINFKNRPPMTEEGRKSISKSSKKTHTGVPKTDDHKEKLSKANTGKIPTAETRKKISDITKVKGGFQTMDFSGENNSFFGKKHSEESLKKMTDIKKGKKFDQDHKDRLKITAKIKLESFLLTWELLSDEIKEEKLKLIISNIDFNNKKFITDISKLLNIAKRRVKPIIKILSIELYNKLFN